jgi:thioredoxin-like negative regulator of GroEL
MVGDALAQVDPDLHAFLDGDVAVALAQAGLAEQARARIESNLARWPDDFWIRLQAGDALAVLGDLDGAAAHFHAALRMADDTDDFEARADAVERLSRIGQGSPNKQRRPPTGQSRRQTSRRSASRRKRKR